MPNQRAVEVLPWTAVPHRLQAVVAGTEGPFVIYDVLHPGRHETVVLRYSVERFHLFRVLPLLRLSEDDCLSAFQERVALRDFRSPVTVRRVVCQLLNGPRVR